MKRTSLLAFAATVALGMGGCGGDDDATPGGGGGGSCKSAVAGCYVAGPDGPGNECMAKADFSAGDVTRLRMASHQVKSPSELAAPFMQDTVITKKSALFEPECNLNGFGQFNFLLEVDTAQKQLTLGGGVPQKLVGPSLDGTCWAELTDPVSSLKVERKTASYTEAADGTLKAELDFFVMPIFTEDLVDKYALVPLHEVTLSAKLSADKNCVGRYASEKLSTDSSCEPPEGEFAWEPAGRYEGYITVAEADSVMVYSLGKTLCVVLTGDPTKWEGTDHDCKSSEAFKSGGLPKGDWCAATNSAGGCEDSWKLVIDFAAQAIEIGGVYGQGCG